MTRPSTENRRLARLTKICLALPETSRQDSGRHASFLGPQKKPLLITSTIITVTALSL
jgi:hypothetical protein